MSIDGNGLKTVSVVGDQVAERVHELEEVALAVGEDAAEVRCRRHARPVTAAEAPQHLHRLLVDCDEMDKKTGVESVPLKHR